MLEYLVAPLATMASCQVFKFVYESTRARRAKWGRLFNGSGGMPSSHTAFAVSATTMAGLGAGINSPLFAVALVFTVIIMYDSMGLRRESGKQAAAINQLIDEVFESPDGYKQLKEELGHRPLEVFVGLLIGVGAAFFFYYVVYR